MSKKKRLAQGLSRRQFVQSTVGAGVALAHSRAVAASDENAGDSPPTPEDPIEAVLAQHGSEFGRLRRVR